MYVIFINIVPTDFTLRKNPSKYLNHENMSSWCIKKEIFYFHCKYSLNYF